MQPTACFHGTPGAFQLSPTVEVVTAQTALELHSENSTEGQEHILFTTSLLASCQPLRAWRLFGVEPDLEKGRDSVGSAVAGPRGGQRIRQEVIFPVKSYELSLTSGLKETFVRGGAEHTGTLG